MQHAKSYLAVELCSVESSPRQGAGHMLDTGEYSYNIDTCKPINSANIDALCFVLDSVNKGVHQTSVLWREKYRKRCESILRSSACHYVRSDCHYVHLLQLDQSRAVGVVSLAEIILECAMLACD